MAELPLNK